MSAAPVSALHEDVSATTVEPSERVRVSWRLSPSGSVAACTMVGADGVPLLEVRDRTCSGTQRVVAVPGLSVQSQLLPDDDGSVVLCHHRRGAHLVESVTAGGETTRIATFVCQSVQLVRAGADVLVLEGDGARTHVHRLFDGGFEPVVSVDGRALGAVALGGAGERLVLNLMQGTRPSEAVAIDVATGVREPFFAVRPTSEDQVVDHVTGANLVVVSTTAWGEPRIGFGRPRQEPVRFPDGLPTGAVTYLGASRDGTGLAVSVEQGAVSSIRIVSTVSGEVTAPDLPPLVVLGRGHLGEDELVVPVATPHHAGTLLRLDLLDGSWELDDETAAASVPVRITTLPGAAGPIECIVLGEPETARTVAVALHGGPLDAWRAHHEPLLAGLARAGVAVVAPNVRGSTCYGADHALAIRDQWGGPDLADVLAVSEALRDLRGPGLPRPVVLGHSYGAWLAVLAAAAEPFAWSGCVPVSPFVSGRRVVDGGGPVAELVRRLGGTSGPDLTTVVHRITAPVLVLHGVLDTVVPVAEAVHLAEALDPDRSCLLRLVDCGHDVFTSPRRQDAIESIAAFCHHSSRRTQSVRTTSSTERR
jgi:pimeloyl-ACP methyl ester carboxylesterase